MHQSYFSWSIRDSGSRLAKGDPFRVGVRIRLPILAVLGFQITYSRSETPALYPKILPRCGKKTGTSATTVGMGTRGSKIQDGEDVDILRSPGPNRPKTLFCRLGSKPHVHLVNKCLNWLTTVRFGLFWSFTGTTNLCVTIFEIERFDFFSNFWLSDGWKLIVFISMHHFRWRTIKSMKKSWFFGQHCVILENIC